MKPGHYVPLDEWPEFARIYRHWHKSANGWYGLKSWPALFKTKNFVRHTKHREWVQHRLDRLVSKMYDNTCTSWGVKVAGNEKIVIIRRGDK